MMRRSTILLGLLIAGLFLSDVYDAAAQVFVQIQQPPPNQLRVSDLWKITLSNTTRETYKVYLRGVVTEERDGQVVDAQSSIFDLPPGTKTITASAIEPIKVNASQNKYRNVALQTGTVPPGEYTACVYVIAARDREELGSDCIEQRVEQLSPPILVAPTDESTAAERSPTFVWTPPVPLPPGQRPTYGIRIVEVLGRQSPFDALQRNSPWFEREDIPSTTFQYPASARALEEGRWYAWQITAYGEGYVMGQSEAWKFRSKSQTLVLDTATVKKLVAYISPTFRVLAVAGGLGHSLVVKLDKSVHSWGNDQYNQLGRGGTGSAPGPVSGLSNALQVAAGAEHSVALIPSGLGGIVQCWGSNDFGQLGNNSATGSSTPKSVTLGNVQAIAAGSYHTLALLNNGAVYAWGYNRTGELGLGTQGVNTPDTNRPVQVSGLSNVVAIAAGDGHNLALKSDGTVWAWGNNDYGQLGAAAPIPYSSSPIKVGDLSSVVAVAAGGNHSLALKSDGTVWAWGSNSSGQLGDGTTEDQPQPVKVSGLGGSLGLTPSAASQLKNANAGAAAQHQLTDLEFLYKRAELSGTTAEGGNRNQTNVQLQSNQELTVSSNISGPAAFALFANFSKVVAIAAGGSHSLAVRGDSTVWGWGNNYWGAVGDGTYENRTKPVKVENLGSIIGIAAGNAHSFAQFKTGGLYIWGSNAYNQIGRDIQGAAPGPGGESAPKPLPMMTQ